MKKLLPLIVARKLIGLVVGLSVMLCGCVNNPVDTSTDPDNMVDSFAVNKEREEESRLQEALKDLCPYDRNEWEGFGDD